MAALAPMWYQDPALGLDTFRGGSPYHASPSGGAGAAGGIPSYASPFPASSPSHPVMMPSSAHHGMVSRAPLQPLPRAPSPISNLQPGRSVSPPTPLHHRNQPQFFGVSASSSSPYTFTPNSRLHQHTSSSFMCSPLMMLKSSNNITASAENEPPQQQQQQPQQPLNMCSPLAVSVSVAASPFSSATEFSLFSSPPTRLLKTPLPHYSTPSSFSYFHLPFLCTGTDEQPKRLSLPSPIGSPPSSGGAVDSSPTSSLFHFDMSWGALDQTSCCSTSSSVKSSTDSTPTSSQEPSPVSSQSPSPSLSPLSSPPCSRPSSQLPSSSTEGDATKGHSRIERDSSSSSKSKAGRAEEKSAAVAPAAESKDEPFTANDARNAYKCKKELAILKLRFEQEERLRRNAQKRLRSAHKALAAAIKELDIAREKLEGLENSLDEKRSRKAMERVAEMEQSLIVEFGEEALSSDSDLDVPGMAKDKADKRRRRKMKPGHGSKKTRAKRATTTDGSSAAGGASAASVGGKKSSSSRPSKKD